MCAVRLRHLPFRKRPLIRLRAEVRIVYWRGNPSADVGPASYLGHLPPWGKVGILWARRRPERTPLPRSLCEKRVSGSVAAVSDAEAIENIHAAMRTSPLQQVFHIHSRGERARIEAPPSPHRRPQPSPRGEGWAFSRFGTRSAHSLTERSALKHEHARSALECGSGSYRLVFAGSKAAASRPHSKAPSAQLPSK